MRPHPDPRPRMTPLKYYFWCLQQGYSKRVAYTSMIIWYSPTHAGPPETNPAYTRMHNHLQRLGYV